jgi:hypothetical protein
MKENLGNMIKVMVLARLQSEGKFLENLNKEEINFYVNDAAQDLKFALDMIAANGRY